MALWLSVIVLQSLQTLTGSDLQTPAALGFILVPTDIQPPTVDGTIHQTVRLPLKHNVSHPAEVFSLEWRVIRNKTARPILISSPDSPFPFIPETFLNRIEFSQSTAELSLQNLQLADEGMYELEVTTSDGRSHKSSVFLTVNVAVAKPHIEIIPEVPQVERNVTLKCSVLEGNLVQYSWYRCEQPLSTGADYYLSHNNSWLTLLKTQGTDAGTYRCKVTNRISSKYTDFVLQFCPTVSKSIGTGYGYIGYGGYPGYIGYIILIVLYYCWNKKNLKPSKEYDVIYENSHVKEKLSQTASGTRSVSSRRGR